MMAALNEKIENDHTALGTGFRIDHSFFVPGRKVIDEAGWLREVVEFWSQKVGVAWFIGRRK